MPTGTTHKGEGGGLSYWERKQRLRLGAGMRVAALTGYQNSTVTYVLKGRHRNREIERALAAEMVPRTSVGEAFGPAAPSEKMRRVRRALVAA